jgi:hypothetical protein
MAGPIIVGDGSASGGAATTTYTNGSGVAMTQGQAVYILASGSISLASAAVGGAASNDVVGLVDPTAGIASGSSGDVGGFDGTARTARFESGLTLTPGDRVYLSPNTPGSLTNVQPSVSGQLVQELGFLKDALTYDGVTDFLAEVHTYYGPRVEVP